MDRGAAAEVPGKVADIDTFPAKFDADEAAAILECDGGGKVAAMLANDELAARLLLLVEVAARLVLAVEGRGREASSYPLK